MVRANVLPCLQEERSFEYTSKQTGKRVKYEDYINKKVNRVIPKGCKEWCIDGITVIALNEKNANRKINNIKRRNEEIARTAS